MNHFFTILKFNLTKNIFVRGFFYPFMNIISKINCKKYSKTQDAQYIRKFHNKYLGKRCFIIGNGPSLKISDLNKLKNEITFAFNRIYYIFDKTDWRPTFYLSIDKSVIDQNQSEIPIKNLNEIFLDCYAKKYFDDNNAIHYLCGDNRFFLKPWKPWKMDISKDITQRICSGGTVTFAAIQMAIYMGFKKIYLLGVDHNYSIKMNSKGKIEKNETVKDYMEGLKSTALTTMCYEVTTKAYEVANKYCENNGITIVNCTRGGKLEAFPKESFENLFIK